LRIASSNSGSVMSTVLSVPYKSSGCIAASCAEGGLNAVR
jgi:hypothetical protein